MTLERPAAQPLPGRAGLRPGCRRAGDVRLPPPRVAACRAPARGVVRGLGCRDRVRARVLRARRSRREAGPATDPGRARRPRSLKRIPRDADGVAVLGSWQSVTPISCARSRGAGPTRCVLGPEVIGDTDLVRHVAALTGRRRSVVFGSGAELAGGARLPARLRQGVSRHATR